MPPPNVDWTADPSTGRVNSSDRYREIVYAVETLIRGDAHQLIAGNAELTARLITAQLAHVHDLAPREATVREVCDWLEGRIGHGGAFTSADDVRDAIRACFLQPARHEQDHQHQQHNQQDRNQEVRGDGGGGDG